MRLKVKSNFCFYLFKYSDTWILFIAIIFSVSFFFDFLVEDKFSITRLACFLQRFFFWDLSRPFYFKRLKLLSAVLFQGCLKVIGVIYRCFWRMNGVLRLKSFFSFMKRYVLGISFFWTWFCSLIISKPPKFFLNHTIFYSKSCFWLYSEL